MKEPSVAAILKLARSYCKTAKDPALVVMDSEGVGRWSVKPADVFEYIGSKGKTVRGERDYSIGITWHEPVGDDEANHVGSSLDIGEVRELFGV